MRSVPASLFAMSDQAPPLWELEWRIVEIACECVHEDRSGVTPDAELVADLGLDCLAVVEFLMTIEEAFDVTLPDDQIPRTFSERATLRTLAEWVKSRWGTGTGDRGDWKRPGGPAEPVEALPFTQLGGALTGKEWLDGPLYEPIGTNREGFPQYRRRTDGMRCVLLPEAEVWIGS